MFLIDDILLAPLHAIVWLGKKLNDAAIEDFSDEGRIKEQLMELQLRFELDEISEEELIAQENELLKRININ
jgi:hypothetical protein